MHEHLSNGSVDASVFTTCRYSLLRSIVHRRSGMLAAILEAAGAQVSNALLMTGTRKCSEDHQHAAELYGSELCWHTFRSAGKHVQAI